MSTQPHINWVPGLFARVNGWGINHSSEFIAKVKNEWRFASILPVCLHGMNKEDYFVTFTYGYHLYQRYYGYQC
jgi:hypothetical protein